MKPYGEKIDNSHVRGLRPRSGTQGHRPGGRYDMSKVEIIRIRRGLKKTARQDGKESLKEQSEDEEVE